MVMMAKEQTGGSSLIVLDAEKFELKDKLELPLQTRIEKYKANVVDTGPLKSSPTYIALAKDLKEEKVYLITQYTDVVKEAIRVYIDRVRDYEYGYQRKLVFQLIYRKKDSRVFIFATKTHIELFLKRLEEIGNQIILKRNHFDFVKLVKIPEIRNIWAVWEDVNLAHKKTNASFGIDVHKAVGVKLENATSVSINILVDGKMYAIGLSSDGRINSPHRISQDKLIEIFDRYLISILRP
ncbi:MAG: hypothetical protein M1500_00525 [Candidatus Marsarchaeota archaeon]|nr:hypothetical protein [Candidatus Marsarchaeota archaeon]